MNVTTKKTEFVIGAKSVAINANTNSLSITGNNINVVFLNAQTKMYWNLLKDMVAKVSVNISKQEFSQKEQEKQKVDYERTKTIR